MAAHQAQQPPRPIYGYSNGAYQSYPPGSTSDAYGYDQSHVLPLGQPQAVNPSLLHQQGVQYQQLPAHYQQHYQQPQPHSHQHPHQHQQQQQQQQHQSQSQPYGSSIAQPYQYPSHDASGLGYHNGHGGPNGHGYTGSGSSPSHFDEGQVQGGIGRWKGAEKEGPVKNACLSCRSKKAKCDGTQPVCGQCDKKGIECVFVKSRRGGARKKRETVPPSALQEFLKKLDGLLGLHDPSLSPGHSEPSEDTTDIVREFTSREEILSCYYTEVHPFLPVMPQRKHLKQVLESLMEDSPFLLAAQTILVLVPHPLDQNAKSSNSKRLRSASSHALGHRAMVRVEELLSQGSSSLECVQALTILSLWEWGNAGNQTKNRARAGQAIQVAMEMGLHEFDKHSDGRSIEGENWHADMARRTWWISYVAQLTAAMVSGNEPIVGSDDPRIRVDFPICSISDNSWPNWVEANRQCNRMFSLVNSVYFGQASDNTWGKGAEPGSEEERQEMARRMIEVDQQVVEMMKEAEKLAVIELVPGGEEEVVRNQQLSARLGLAVTHIHIHRQQAFPEVSLFSKKICGLPQAPDYSAQMAQATGHDEAAKTFGADGTPVSIGHAVTGAGELAQSNSNPSDIGNSMLNELDNDDSYGHSDVIEEMWQPDTFPENLPAPWFTHVGGAAALYAPTHSMPVHIPALTANITPVRSPDADPASGLRRGSTSGLSGTSAKGTGANGTAEPHQAWGVDANDKPTSSAPASQLQIFPPGISLARCATAAHTIVRLEVLHRSAAIALWDGPPKWLPFCACGLVSGAYAFLLLALAVQAESTFGSSKKDQQEVDKLLTNVKVILAGLEAYGTMWAGIDVMAGEVRAALEAATRLPTEVRGQIEAISTVGGSDVGPSPAARGTGGSVQLSNSGSGDGTPPRYPQLGQEQHLAQQYQQHQQYSNQQQPQQQLQYQQHHQQQQQQLPMHSVYGHGQPTLPAQPTLPGQQHGYAHGGMNGSGTVDPSQLLRR